MSDDTPSTSSGMRKSTMTTPVVIREPIMYSTANSKRHIVYLARHGESLGNVERAFVPPDEDVLSETGQRQADLLAKYLSRENITRVYSSDFSRAYNTAKAIVNHSKNAENLVIKTDPRLRERNCGIYEGKSYKEAISAVLQSGRHIMAYDPPEGEKMKELGVRMNLFFKEMCAELDNSDEEAETVVIVSHSFAIIKFIDILSHSGNYSVSSWDQAKGFKLMRNASFMKMGVDSLQESVEDMDTLPAKRNVEFLTFHETGHLKSLEENDTLVRYTQVAEEGKAFSGCIQT